MDTSFVRLLDWQIWIIGIVASLLAMLINWLSTKAQPIKIGKKTITLRLGRYGIAIIVMLISAGLAYWWSPFALPALPVVAGLTFAVGLTVVLDYGKALVQALWPYLAVAVVIYDYIFQYLYDPIKRQQIWKAIKAWVMHRLGIPDVIS